jgi:NAD(P)-dependent dehydrogenase (short-subunit alcohol dehydrogenase family)
MVKYAEILKSNSSFFSTRAASNLTAVFVGATQGIGLGALRAFAKHTSGASPTIYLVGRSQRSLDALKSQVADLNASAKVYPVRADDLTLVKDAQAAANQIASQAEKIDFLIMSPGYVSTKRVESPEGLDRVQAIRFYSRMRFLATLSPLLQKSSNPHVVSVLGAGLEGKLWADDLHLKDHFSLPNAAGAAGSMMSLYLEQFSKQSSNDRISLVHTFPGIVGGTGLKLEGIPWILQPLFDWVALPLMRLFGYTIEEAGERALYAATSDKFTAKGAKSEGAAKGSDGSVGSGVYLLDQNSEPVPGNKVLDELRSEGLGSKVWAHTNEVFAQVERS